MQIQCRICGRFRNRKPSDQHHLCSFKCRDQSRFLQICHKYSPQYYKELYIEKKLSFRKIEALAGINVKTLRKIFHYLNIPIRHGSEAVKTQWINNPERRKQASEIISKVNPNRGRTLPYHKLIWTKQHQKWRKLIKERDTYTCQSCKCTGNRLHAHHVKNIIDFPELKNDLNNGITLCDKCHGKLHSQERLSQNISNN